MLQWESSLELLNKIFNEIKSKSREAINILASREHLSLCRFDIITYSSI